MKKKYVVSSKDKKTWLDYTKKMNNITIKESDLSKKNILINKTRKLDLHGFTLMEANQKVKEFISESFNFGYKKLLIITGKGSRSQSGDNPFVSEKLGILKNSVPDFVKNEKNISNKIIRIVPASLRDGGDGAFYIFLKKNSL